MATLEQILNDSRPEYDIASPVDHQRVRSLAETMIEGGLSVDQLVTIGNETGRNLDARVGSKLAQSRLALDRALASGWTGSVAVVVAMWGEQRRLRPAGQDNPTGEDALHVKLDQLDWLLGDGEGGVDWRIYAVDDGDPDDSAAVAEERAALHRHGRRVHVLRLAEVVPAQSGPLAALAHPDESRKGGAIVYGAASAMQDGMDAAIITDADNSVDLAQIGLLVGKHAAGADVVIGDRKNPDSVLVKAEARWGPGIVALRHMQRMVGRQLFDRGINDTQAAFKLYGRSALNAILAAPSTYGFSFDSDWLFATIAEGLTIESVPFAFIDSFAESASITQGPMTTWESLLRGLVAAARARGVAHNTEMAAVIEDLADAATLEHVVQNVPDELAGVDPSRLGDPSVMSPSDMRAWIESVS